jgi:secreted PhoX family phosphatase
MSKIIGRNLEQALLKEAIDNPSRRNILRGGLGLGALSFLGLSGCGGSSGSAMPAKGLNFTATPISQTYDGVKVAEGYKVELLYKLGDPINASTPAYLNNGTETSASFDFRAGDHHDGMYFFGLGSNNKWNKTVSDKGILCINHEAITPLFLHTNGPTPETATANRTVADEVQKEFRLHGVSVVEVSKVNGAFQVNLASTFNRRITTLTDMDIAGPLRGHNLLKTKYSPTGVKTRGTVNNCASGYTPWGTYLTCEENYAGYFYRPNTTGRSANDLASEARNGIGDSRNPLGRERWATVGNDDTFARWNVGVLGATSADDYRYAGNTYGFNVEIDPFAPTSTPKKRTAMGRFAHEGAWVGPVTVGKPVVFYMGCDSNNEYIYKFVSTALWVASDLNGGMAVGDKYLDDGKLYVARFNSDFSGEWLELTNLAGQQANIYGQQSQLGQSLGQGIGNLASQQFGIGAQMAQGLGSLGTQQANIGMQNAALGQQAQAMGQQDTNFMYNLGTAQQKQAQAELDAERQNTLQQNMQPYQQAAFVSDIYKGAPSSSMSSMQQVQAAPSPFQQAVGLGTAGLTAYAAGAKAGI